MGVKKKIGVLPGDGIGPEVVKEGIKVMDAIAERFGHEFEYAYGDVGAIAIDKTGNPLPDETLAVCEQSDAFLFGAIGEPKYDNDPTAKISPGTQATLPKIIKTTSATLVNASAHKVLSAFARSRWCFCIVGATIRQ